MKEKLVSSLKIHRKPNSKKNDDLEMGDPNERLTVLETTVSTLIYIVGELVEQLRLTNLASANQRSRSKNKGVMEVDGNEDIPIFDDSSDANSVKERPGSNPRLSVKKEESLINVIAREGVVLEAKYGWRKVILWSENYRGAGVDGAEVESISLNRKLEDSPPCPVVKRPQEAVVETSRGNEMLKLEGNFKAVTLADPVEVRSAMELKIVRVSYALKGPCVGFGEGKTKLEKELVREQAKLEKEKVNLEEEKFRLSSETAALKTPFQEVVDELGNDSFATIKALTVAQDNLAQWLQDDGYSDEVDAENLVRFDYVDCICIVESPNTISANHTNFGLSRRSIAQRARRERDRQLREHALFNQDLSNHPFESFARNLNDELNREATQTEVANPHALNNITETEIPPPLALKDITMNTPNLMNHVLEDAVNEDEEFNAQAYLHYSVLTDHRRYNMPTMDEIAVILPGDGYQISGVRDIVVYHKENQGLMHISECHPDNLLLHYVIFFPTGQLD
ncbi:hypothetical protein GIB67_034167 [Kingdonia uniflora]|uniref:Uncharacterized protein n=1 Tax=Kingdonia uniflora TaxID=39325 RepID=A0A7J7LS25_9MAGN|nr:hypothetical protein GIB67_034167 [Kingdonia uniflora]